MLGIVVAIGIVTEHCEGLTIPTVDHFPPHKRRLAGRGGVKGRCVRTVFLHQNGAITEVSATVHPVFMGGCRRPPVEGRHASERNM